MTRSAQLARKTTETDIQVSWVLDGAGTAAIDTGIAFFDHMLTLFAVHGRFDLTVKAIGDLAVDAHHTVEDVGLVMGQVLDAALDARAAICRYGHAVVPMDETLTAVTIDLSNRPYLAFNLPRNTCDTMPFDGLTAKEFFRAFSNKAGMNLHINVAYGENGHHILESIFKAAGRALRGAVTIDPTLSGIPSTKGVL